MTRRISVLARRLADEPDFLAAALADYARSQQLDDAALAAYLGCPMDQLDRLRLCLRPRPDRFLADIDEIATDFGIDPDALIDVVRFSDALARMRRTPAMSESSSLLMAARDRHSELPAAAADGPMPAPRPHAGRDGDGKLAPRREEGTPS